MARTPAVSRDSLSQDQKAAYDAFVEQSNKRGEVPTTGPGSVMLIAPDVALRGLGLARFLPLDTSLCPRIWELAMLLTVRARDYVFIWNAQPLDPPGGKPVSAML